MKYLTVALAMFSCVMCGNDKIRQPLISTTWGQRGHYAKLTPRNARLGCWSVAFAQILHFHKLEPKGEVKYAGKRYSISQSMDSAFDWTLFADSIDDKTPANIRTEVSRYCYYTSIATRKDFFTNNYKGNADVRRKAIESHFSCSTRRYRNYGEDPSSLRDVITKELQARRPLLLFVKPKKKGLAHALVIDGAREVGDRLELHLNFGWDGESNGWYGLERPIKTKRATFDHSDWWVLTIRPK